MTDIFKNIQTYLIKEYPFELDNVNDEKIINIYISKIMDFINLNKFKSNDTKYLNYDLNFYKNN